MLRILIGIVTIALIIYIKTKYLTVVGTYLFLYYGLIVMIAFGFLSPEILPVLKNINNSVDGWLAKAKEEYERGVASAKLKNQGV